jgi:hypothetical protein
MITLVSRCALIAGGTPAVPVQSLSQIYQGPITHYATPGLPDRIRIVLETILKTSDAQRFKLSGDRQR